MNYYTMIVTSEKSASLKTEKEAMDYCYQIDPEVRREIGFGKVIDQKTNKTVAEFPFLLAQVDLDLIDDDDDED